MTTSSSVVISPGGHIYINRPHDCSIVSTPGTSTPDTAGKSPAPPSLTTKEKIMRVAGVVLMIFGAICLLASIGLSIAGMLGAFPSGVAFAGSAVPASLFTIVVGYQLWDKGTVTGLKATQFGITIG